MPQIAALLAAKDGFMKGFFGTTKVLSFFTRSVYERMDTLNESIYEVNGGTRGGGARG